MATTADSGAFSYDASARSVWSGDSEAKTPAERFTTVAREHADRDAIIEAGESGTRRISYAELDDKSSRIAYSLRARCGDEPTRIALLADKDSEQMAALLGILKAGLTAVPLHAANPRSRMEHIVERTGSRFVLTDPPLNEQARAIWPDKIMPIGDAASAPSRVSASSSDAEAIGTIMYTSGSAGSPKGVMLSNHYMLAKAHADTAFYRFTPQDRLSQLFPLSFAAASTHTFGALLNGGALCPYDLSKDGLHHLADWIEDTGVTGLATVPTLFRRFLSSENDAGRFSNVRYVMLGAELVLRSDVELYRSIFPADGVLIHRLAASEVGAISRLVIDSATPLDDAVITAGFPTPQMELLIVDEDGTAVANGEVGELLVRSATLSSGYWGDPDLTAKAFVVDETDPAVRIYRTGDLARRTASGELIHVGRKDGRVKIRGFGVDLVEVERTLLGIPGVKEGAVKVLSTDSGESRLAAYYVAESVLPMAELREHFNAAVPDYMVPSDFVALDALPLTVRGKIDRAALPTPQPSAHAEPFVAPASELEERLAAVWARTLGLPKVSAAAPFFDLGGTSIQAYQLISDIYRELGVDLPASSLLEAPTVRTQADLISGGTDISARSLVPLRPTGSKTPFFAVHGRGGGIIYLHKLAPLLDQERPLYGLQPEVRAGVPPSYMTIEQMAQHYLAEIRMVQPDGPYLLGGSCLGGLIARDMARQLEAEGEKVDLLIAVDPPTGDVTDPSSWTEQKRWSLKWIKGRARGKVRRALAAPKRFVWKLTDKDRSARTAQLAALHSRAKSAHQPPPSRVPLVVLSANSRTRHERFWSEVSLGGLEIEEFSSNHAEMWTPWNRKVVAELIQERLDDVEAKHHSEP